MGNKQSGVQVEDPVEEGAESGVFLSEELNAEIVQSFQSQMLQTEWEKVQTKILTERNARVTEDEARKVNLEENLTAWRAQNKDVQKTMDDAIQAHKDTFNEKSMSIQIDMTDLEQTLGTVPKFGGGDNACFDVRTSLTKCYKEGGDVRKCDDLVNAMEMCVKKTVMS